MRLTFLVSLLGIALLFATLWKYEMAAKNTRIAAARGCAARCSARTRSRPWAERGAVMSVSLFAVAPALPLHTAGKYVAGAYIVFLAIVLVYVAIMATRLSPRPSASWPSCARDVEAQRAARTIRTDELRAGGVSELLAIGVSHKTAPVEVRERLALPDARGAEFLRDLRGAAEVQEAVAISTCNRTELYLVVGDPVEAESTVLAMLASQAGIRPTGAGRGDLLAPQLRRRPPPVPRDRRARVDDRRRGRDPGPGQARLRGRARRRDRRPAHQPPVQGGARDRQAGAHRDRDRRAPAEPAVGRGGAGARACSASSPAAMVVIVGTGETERAGRPRAGRQRRPDRVRGQPPARPRDQPGPPLRRARASSFDELPQALLERADIVVAATSSPHLLLEASELAEVMERARRRPLLLIDLAVPRDIDAACAELEGVSLYDIDDLQAVIARNRKVRQAEARKAEGIIEEEIQQFAAWLGSLEVLPTLAALRAHAD